ncbi:adhesion G protein-coupled receptor E3-like isoform X3 [Xenia sp. Carnegie-2017]|uniref:adhesion G protein-coupled receptor E3-like isoform X3 n=1 Tax=Xenia sp. Carnegie-2017 TaxID=2897299 RepID=UPI001F048808|nr:adhesion G protein-coupled receptor E3-like isoform X3 [Xenia sp. Carnegie-2017]
MDLKLLKLFLSSIALIFYKAVVTNASISPSELKCPRHKMIVAKPFVYTETEEILSQITIVCTIPNVVFKVHYTNGSFCACGLIQKDLVRLSFFCSEALFSLDIIIDLSTNETSQTLARCDVSLSLGLDLRPVHINFLSSASSDNFNDLTFHSKPKLSSTVVSRTIAAPTGHSSKANLQNFYTSVTGKELLPSQVSVMLTSSKSFIKTQSVSQPLSMVTSPFSSTSSILVATSVNELIKPTALSTSLTDITSTVIQPSSSKNAKTSTVSQMTEKMKKFREDLEFIDKLNTSSVNVNDVATVDRILDAASNLITINETIGPDLERKDPGMRAVEVLENLGNTLSQQLFLRNKSSVMFQKVNNDLVFGVAVVNASSSKDFTFPSEDLAIFSDERITIPSTVFRANNSGQSYFVGIIFKAYREMRENTGALRLGTKVINAKVSPAPSRNLVKPIEMLFKKINVGSIASSVCSFWVENHADAGDYGKWATRQCFHLFENQTHVKCRCYHFTNFAVLFKLSNTQRLSKEHSYNLTIITYIGLCASIIGCLFTFIIYLTLKQAKSERAAIHTNLVLSLGLADLVFLLTIIFKPVKDYCLAASMLAFYFYLAVFFWMLVEGVYIYLMVVKVFRGNVTRKRRLAYIVGWGSPFVIGLLTWIILRDDVISKYHCWLSVETGAIWAFVGPGLIIIFVNCIILLAVVKKTWSTFSDKTEFGGLKSASRTFAAIIPLLGITWIFGVMTFNESSLVFQYIFAITNSVQGALIFVLYCLVNKDVRSELLRRLSIWKIRHDMSSSSTGRRNIFSQSAKVVQDSCQDEIKKPGEKKFLLNDIVSTETSKGYLQSNNHMKEESREKMVLLIIH